GAEPLTVETVQLRSPKFEPESPSPRDTQLAPGQLLLLPLPYGPSVCPAGEGADVVVATIGGEAVEVPLTQQPDGVMDELHEVECAEAAVRDAADLTFGDQWEVTGPRSASGEVVVEPRGSTEVVVESMEGNIVFGVRLGAGDLPAPSTFPAELVVDRCDTHALIESKRTFKFPLEVSLDGGDPALVVLEALPGTPARRVLAGLIQACIG
ncbi:MAG TPA: hypothetical protein VD926_07750, partial [Acidimicrobiales bacterium]|nr:hypothetical protein [Acidimicrobiales bacterium]